MSELYYDISKAKLIHKPTKLATAEGTVLGDIPDGTLLAAGIVPFTEPAFDRGTHKAGVILVSDGLATRDVLAKTPQTLKDEANALILDIIGENMPEALELILRWIWANRATNSITPELQVKLQFLVDKWNEIQD